MKRPILYCVVPFCVGIALASFLIGRAGLNLPYQNTQLSLSIISALILISLAALFYKKNLLSHVFLYLALVFFGAAYYQNYNILPANHIANFTLEKKIKVMLQGTVADDPAASDAFYGKKRTTFTLRTESLRLLRRPAFGRTPRNDEGDSDDDWQRVTGLVKTSIYSDEEIKNIGFGDEIMIEGNLSRPKGLKNPGLFDYTDYLKIRNIYAVLSANGSDSIRVFRGSPVKQRYEIASSPAFGGLLAMTEGVSGRVPVWDELQKAAYKLRRGINDAITRYTDSRYSGFLKAILTGERSSLDSAVTDDFIKTGTVHVIAISGLNIALIAGIFIFIFKAFGIKKKFNLLLTSTLLLFYCFVAGANPPVVRATIMFAIVCLGYLIGRESDILNSLAIAAFMILFGNPNELFDPSFQLSFGSIISIIIFAPRIEEAFGGGKSYIVKSAAVSIAASIGVFPIVAKYFNIISPIAVLANLVIVPALFVLTVISFVFLSLNMIGAVFCLDWIGKILSVSTWATFYANHMFARMPLSHIRIPSPSLFFICGYYAFLAYTLLAKNKKYAVMAALAMVSIFVWTQNPGDSEKQLKITFLDVGKGDSILLEFPDKGNMLIDAGSGGADAGLDAGKNVVAPYLWNKGIHSLDALVITHFHEDHMGGALYILKNFYVRCVMDNGIPPQKDARFYGEYKKIISEKGIRRLSVADRDEITGFGAVKLYVLNPPEGRDFPDPNDNSIVIKLEYGKFGAIFTGDISSDAMERVISYDGLLRSDVLKIPHHGGSLGKESTAEKFFKEVSAEVSVTSSGEPYRYGPKKDKVHDRGEVNYDTRINGAVTIFTKGDGFEVEPFCDSGAARKDVIPECFNRESI